MQYHPKSASARIAQQSLNRPPPMRPARPPVHLPPANTQPVAVPRLPPVTSGIPVNHLTEGRVLGAGALNTHFFDGKMGAMLKVIQPEIARAHNIPQKEKLQAFDKLLAVLRPHALMTPAALRCFDAVYRDTVSHPGQTHAANQNYDPVNKLHAEDLLYLLYEKVVEESSEEHAALLAVQLEEMATGLCPQGRTTRFLQVLIMLRDDLTPTSKPLDPAPEDESDEITILDV